MKQFGLLGRTLAHSYSPQIHHALCDYPYELYEKEPNDVIDFIKGTTLSGMNITIPYKKVAFDACDLLSETAQRLQNVNTILINSDGRLYGHNTDYYGFSYMVQKSKIPIDGKKVLVLGSGGASATVCVVLKDLNAREIIVISRNGENNYQNLHLHADAEVIVNTTPVGMYPQTGTAPLDLTAFPHLYGVLDLIYNPKKTALLLQAERLGLACLNGLSMLVAQAKESAELFCGKSIPETEITRVVNHINQLSQNIILIGMPGCGKSTVGKIIAQLSNRPFYDTDEWVEKKSGKTIPQIFQESGEEVFRVLETEALSVLTKESGGVIATGGGCVTRPENYGLLHQNGLVFHLQRGLEELSILGRPLSQEYGLQALYEARSPLYKAFSDFEIAMGLPPEEAAKKVLERYHEHSCY